VTHFQHIDINSVDLNSTELVTRNGLLGKIYWLEKQIAMNSTYLLMGDWFGWFAIATLAFTILQLYRLRH
jgi:hypothetical protein